MITCKISPIIYCEYEGTQQRTPEGALDDCAQEHRPSQIERRYILAMQVEYPLGVNRHRR